MGTIQRDGIPKQKQQYHGQDKGYKNAARIVDNLNSLFPNKRSEASKIQRLMFHMVTSG
jgi:hypothetical protein